MEPAVCFGAAGFSRYDRKKGFVSKVWKNRGKKEFFYSKIREENETGQGRIGKNDKIFLKPPMMLRK